MRYPCPDEDPRRDACPLCEHPTTVVDRYSAPPPQPEPAPSDGSTLVGVLDNIRSALNVGTMLRSADGVALDHLYLGGLTAGADNPKVIKTALGAQVSVPSTSYKDITPLLDELVAQGYEVWAIDFTTSSVPLQSVHDRPGRLAFVVGNERAGVDPAILRRAKRHVHLDMRGAKSTLNVGVAFSTVAHWLRTLPVKAEDAAD